MRPLQPELRELVNKAFCPNRHHPSDHLPIGAVLRLSPPPAADDGVGGAAAANGVGGIGSGSGSGIVSPAYAASEGGSSIYARSEGLPSRTASM